MVELKVKFVCFKWNCINFDDAFESNAASPFLYFVFRILNLDKVQWIWITKRRNVKDCEKETNELFFSFEIIQRDRSFDFL